MPTLQVPAAFKFLYQPGHFPIRAAFGGRGSGKSHGFAQALVLKGAQQTRRILCGREIQLSIKESVKKLLDDKIDETGLRGFYTSTETDIVGRNGTQFLFAGLRTDPQKIKSMEGIDIAWVEEASTVSQRSLDLLMPTVRAPESEVWFTWNPDKATDPVDAMLRSADLEPDWLVREVNWFDNPWFPDVLRKQMDRDKRRDPDKYAHTWLGRYRQNSEARVFHNWEVREFVTPPTIQRFYYGADWGFSIDPTVLVRAFIVGDSLYIDQEAYRVGCEIEDTPALFDQVAGARLWPIRADSARPETISFMQRHGFPKLVAANKGPGSVEDGIEFLKDYNIVVHPRCKHVVDELATYSWKTDKLTGQVLPVLEDKKNHTIDALRYAAEDARPQGHQFAFA